MAKRMIRGRSASSLFLIELIIAIGFFAVASAVCLQLFVRARLVSIQSADLSRATLAAQSAAEAFRGVGGSLEKASALLGGQEDDGALTVWYGPDWNPCGRENAAYRLTLTRGEGRPVPAEILVSRLEDGSSLFSLGVKTP